MLVAKRLGTTYVWKEWKEWMEMDGMDGNGWDGMGWDGMGCLFPLVGGV